MRIDQKREDWGLFDFEDFEPVAAELSNARKMFVKALKADTPDQQATLADQALERIITIGDTISRFHADIFLDRRKQAHAFSRRVVGFTIDLTNTSEAYRKLILDNADFVYLPVPWKFIEPKQQEHNWRPFDSWVDWLTKNRMPIKVGPLVSFGDGELPDWLAMYETDFEAVRNLIFEHARRIVERYANYVYHWDVVSGVHAENTFNFTFEQLMEITRVTVSLVKQLAPRAQAVVDLVSPWGEYYARNQRTIPPMLYADMVVQSGVGFDGLGARFLFGAPAEGMFVRDLFQISEKLDRLGNFGKPVHITAVQVPSAAPKANNGAGGHWRKPWDEKVQAMWLKEFYEIALSKPFVESINWVDLVDRPKVSPLPQGGLVRPDMKPKPALKVLQEIRSGIHSSGRTPPAPKPTR
jgi:hypothetical protein